MIVVDTSVVVRGLRTPSGPSGWIVRAMLVGTVPFALSNALLIEYEAVITRPKLLRALRLEVGEAETLLDAIAGQAHTADPRFSFRPQLRDPDDEIVLECAIAAAAGTIVTGDKDFSDRVLSRFGIVAKTPGAYVHERKDAS